MKLEAPILLAGLDHAGKTPLRLALERHPALTTARRLDLWTELRARHARARSVDQRSALLDELVHGRSAALRLEREPLAAALESGSFRAVAIEIGRQLCTRTGAARWCLQEALVEWRVEAVLRDFPAARVVQLVRDPRDRHLAMLQGGAVGRSGLAGETAAWVASARIGLAHAAARPHAFMLLRHEALLDDPEGTLRTVCDFIGEDYRPEMLAEGPLSPGERERLRAGVGRFRDGLVPRQVDFIQRRARTELTACGYASEPILPRTAMLPHRAADAARWHAGRLAWWLQSGRLRARIEGEG